MEIDLRYLAGFFDGEGSIGIYANGSGRGRTLRVQLTQNCSPLVDDFLLSVRDRWGGSLTVMTGRRGRAAWNYQASAATGVMLLRDLRPWLIFKAEQADVALAWWWARPIRGRDALGHMLSATPEMIAVDEAASLRLKELKRDPMADAINVKGN